MFGNAITDGMQVATGTYGYVVSFDLSTLEVQKILQVQMQSAAGVLSDPATAETARAALFALCEDTQTGVDFAFCLDGQVLNIFCRTLAYDYLGTVRMAFWILRNAIDMAAATDTIDVAQDKEELFRLMVLEKMYVNGAGRVPQNIANAINAEKARLGV
jgi:hypothetical protein